MPIAPDWRERRQRRQAVGVSVLLTGLTLAVLWLLSGPDPAPEQLLGRPTGNGARPPAAAPATVPQLSLHGTHWDIGRQHGLRLKQPIQRLLEAYHQLDLPGGLTHEQAAQRLTVLNRHLPQELVDELQGLAEGSGLPYDDLLALQALPELGLAPTAVAYAATYPATQSSPLLVGYSFGPPPATSTAWSAALGQALTLMAIDAEGEHAWVGLGLAGLVTPLVGFNGEGLTVGVLPPPPAEASPTAAEDTPEGRPTLLLARSALAEAETIDTTGRLLDDASRARPVHLLLGQLTPRPEVVLAETQPQRWVVRPAEQGRLVDVGRARALRTPPLPPAETDDDPRYDSLWAWLLDHAGSLNTYQEPLLEAAGRPEAALAVVTLDPSTQRLRVLRPPFVPAAGSLNGRAAVAANDWLHWSAETNTLAPVEEGSE